MENHEQYFRQLKELNERYGVTMDIGKRCSAYDSIRVTFSDGDYEVRADGFLKYRDVEAHPESDWSEI